MTNKLYVDVTFSYFESKSGYECIKTTIRDVQLVLLEMAKDIDEICRMNNICADELHVGDYIIISYLSADME